MKRSEMVYALVELMLEYPDGDPVDASQILKGLEDLGMLPPSYRKYIAEDLLMDGKVIGLDQYKMDVNEWEKEDET